jgi:hypothetical protein
MTDKNVVRAVITTTGELREYLLKAMEWVRLGEMDIDQASKIIKMAQQVNEGLYAEIKSARVTRDLDPMSVAPPLGALSLLRTNPEKKRA